MVSVHYWPSLQLKLTLCSYKGCEKIIPAGMYYCREHVRPDLRQSEAVDPKLAARNRMVLAGECFVYAVDAGDAVKIGKAIDPHSRFAGLQTGSPVDLVLLGFVLGPKTLERTIHKWAEPHRRRGEWFVKSDPIRRMVEAIQTGQLQAVQEVLRQNT